MFLGLALTAIDFFALMLSVPVGYQGDFYQYNYSQPVMDSENSYYESNYTFYSSCYFDLDFLSYADDLDSSIYSSFEKDGNTINYLGWRAFDTDVVVNQNNSRTYVFYFDRVTDETFNFNLIISCYASNSSHDDYVSTIDHTNYNYALPRNSVSRGVSVTIPSSVFDSDLYFNFVFEYQLYDESTYNILSGYNSNTDYQQGYEQGYHDSIEDNRYEWEKSGYDQGYDYGYDVGYQFGFSDGVSTDSTRATIFANIFQVGMVPVNFFLAIFNYEIFGINLRDLITAILTISIIIIVLKSVFGNLGGNGDGK